MGNELEKWGSPVKTSMDRWLVEAWCEDVEERGWLLFEQTAEDRAALAQHREECNEAAKKALEARVIEDTATRDETPVPNSTKVLFPIWEACEPMADALRLVVARSHLEAA